MIHEPEFQKPRDNAEAKQKAAELAALYRRVFQSDDGKRVLEDLAHRFNLEAGVFTGNFEPIPAAVKDGQRQVVIHIKALSKPNP